MRVLNSLAAIAAVYVAGLLVGAYYGLWQVGDDAMRWYLGVVYAYFALIFVDRVMRGSE